MKIYLSVCFYPVNLFLIIYLSISSFIAFPSFYAGSSFIKHYIGCLFLQSTLFIINFGMKNLQEDQRCCWYFFFWRSTRINPTLILYNHMDFVSIFLFPIYSTYTYTYFCFFFFVNFCIQKQIKLFFHSLVKAYMFVDARIL